MHQPFGYASSPAYVSPLNLPDPACVTGNVLPRVTLLGRICRDGHAGETLSKRGAPKLTTCFARATLCVTRVTVGVTLFVRAVTLHVTPSGSTAAPRTH